MAFGPAFDDNLLGAHGRSLATDSQINMYRLLSENIPGDRLDLTDVCQLYQDLAGL